MPRPVSDFSTTRPVVIPSEARNLSSLGTRQPRSRHFRICFFYETVPPDGANRGRYRNPRIDVLTDQIPTESDQE